MKKLLSLLLLVSSYAFAGTVTGQITTATSGPIINGTLTLTPTQAFVVTGTATVVSSAVACYTDASGNVVGEPNPLVAPVVTPNTGSGTLTAGTYFTRFAYQDATGTTFYSFETTTILTSTGSLIVTAPVKQPATATGYKVFISTSSSTETLQGTVTGTPGTWANYTQSVPLAAGSALPSTNTTACKPYFSDEGIPGFSYLVGLSNSSGSNVSGFPQRWRLFGGSAGTVNLSLGMPISDGVVVYPQPIISTPAFNATQSILGPLNLNGFGLTAGNGTFSGNMVESGTTTIGKLNSVNFVDGTKFTTINAAENDYGSNQGVVVVPPTFGTGAGQSLLSLDNIFVIDQRQVLNPCAQNTHLHFNVKDTNNGSVRQKWIVCDEYQPAVSMQPGSSSASVEGAAFLEGNLNGLGVLEALNGTTIVDSGATSSPGAVIGVEGTAKVLGTVANTITDARGGTFNCGAAGAGNITTCTGLYAQAPSQSSTGTIANAVSFRAEKPTVGTATNKSIQSDGQVQVGTIGGASSGGTNSLLTIVAGANPAMSFQNTAAGVDNKNWDVIVSGSDYQVRAVNDANSGAATAFDCSRSGTSITQCLFPAGIKVGTNGTLMTFTQHKRVSTGSIGGTTRAEVLVTWASTFNDTSYTVTCNVEDSTTAAATQGLTFERLRTKSATQIGLVINNPTGGAITGTIDCVGHHD